MAFLIKDRVLETCSSPGTGAVTLLGAVTGYQSFSGAFSSTNGTTTYYAIADQGGANWEVGLGTWNTGNTFTRNTVLASSNGGSTVNFASGTQNIFCTYPSEKAIYIDSSGNTYVPNLGATTQSTGAFTSVTASADITVHGLTVGLGGGSVSTNTVAGTSSLQANTSGANNTAIGYSAGYNNTTGARNSFSGAYAGYFNTTGTSNTSLGYSAYAANTTTATGSYNTAIGDSALINNTTASNNTAVGYQAGYSNQTGTQLTALGYLALYSNTASYNVGIGAYSGQNTTSGNQNTFLGRATGLTNITGSNNVYIGDSTGYLSTGSNNTFVGFSAGTNVTTGSKNTIIGAYSGNQGGLDIRTSSNYIVLSDGDGNPRLWSNGSGQFVFNGSATLSAVHSVYGQSGLSPCSLQVFTNGDYGYTFKNASGTLVGNITVNSSATAFVTSSDYRLKENVAPMIGALDKVAKLKPVTYTWKTDNSDGEGFIAHELAEVCPYAVVGEKDAVDAEGKPVYQGIDTSFLVATLTAAIQELKAEFDAYKVTHP